jgi:hypothetical protein
VLIVVGYVAIGEFGWLLSLAGWSLHEALQRTLVVLLTVGCAVAAGLSLRRACDPPAVVTASTALRGGVAAGAVIAAVWPAIRPGHVIGTAEFVLPSVDIIHNMSRAAVVQHLGYIPYGMSSPVTALSGDYYPRGFHLVASLLARSLGVDPQVDTELWALDFARMFWLMWALVLVALAVWAVRLQESQTGARLVPLVCVAATAPALLLLHPVFFGIIVPGFPSFALAILATIVSLMHLSSDGHLARALPLTAVCAVVIGHSWPTLLLIVGLAAAARLVRERREASTSGVLGPSLTVGLVSLVLILRPVGSTLLSGDAANQARQNGSIAVVPTVILAALALGGVVWLLSPVGANQRVVIASALLGAALLEVAALFATDWDWSLYYPRKVVWASVLIFLSPLAMAAQQLTCMVTDRVHRRAPRVRAEILATMCSLFAVAIVVRGVSSTMLMNRPLLEARIAALAHQALGRSDVQIVAHRYMTQDSDYAANMWGRGGLELQGVAALNLSDLNVWDLPRQRLCGFTGLKRPLLVYSSQDLTSPTTCGFAGREIGSVGANSSVNPPR